MFCPKCKAEYVSGITMCADCNVPLVHVLPSEPTETEKETMGKDNMNAEETKKFDANKYEELYLSFNQGEVMILKSILDQEGIRYFCRGDHMEEYSFLEPVRFFVHKDDVADATAIFEDLEKSKPADPGTEPPTETDHTD